MCTFVGHRVDAFSDYREFVRHMNMRKETENWLKEIRKCYVNKSHIGNLDELFNVRKINVGRNHFKYRKTVKVNQNAQ